jgi:hypothetical protein
VTTRDEATAAKLAHVTAHTEVLEYVLGLNTLAGHPVAAAHEIYERHRSLCTPLLKARQYALHLEEAGGVSANEALVRLDRETAAQWVLCFEALRVLWLTEFADEHSGLEVSP